MQETLNARNPECKEPSKQIPFNIATVQIISSTVLNFNYSGQAVQFKYRLYKAKWDGTPNECSPTIEIYVSSLKSNPLWVTLDLKGMIK